MPDPYFGAEYLQIAEPEINSKRSDADAALLAGLLELNPTMKVLDLCCGHGRISNRLASSGAEIVGVDASRRYIDLARADAARAGLRNVRFDAGDMREIEADAEYDAVISWYISFGYFDDGTNKDVLRRVRRALRPSGRLVLELNALHHVLKHWESATTDRRDDLVVTDERSWDPTTGMLQKVRTVTDATGTRQFPYQIRLFSFPEIAMWLRDVGFARVAVYGEASSPYSEKSKRMIIRADVD